MPDVHSLILKSDSTQIKKSSKDLDSLSTSAQKTEKSTNKLNDSNKGLLSTLRTMPAIITAVTTSFGISKYIDYADAMTNVNSKLRLVTDSTYELAKAEEELFKISQDTRVSFTDSVDLYSRMARSTQELAISQKDLLNITETINKTLIISGGSADSANAALMQLGQGFASGTLRGEELNSVMEQTPRLAQAIADGMGVSIGQLRALGAEGKITAEVVVEALKTQSQSVSEEFSKMTMTVDQSMVTLQNSVLKTIGRIDKEFNITSGLSREIDEFARLLDKNIEDIASYVRMGQATATIVANGWESILTTSAIGYLEISYAFESEIESIANTMIEFSNKVVAELAKTFNETKAFWNLPLDDFKISEFKLFDIDTKDTENKIKELKKEIIDLGKETDIAFEILASGGTKPIQIGKKVSDDISNELDKISTKTSFFDDFSKNLGETASKTLVDSIADALDGNLDIQESLSTLASGFGSAMAQQALMQGNAAGFGVGVGVMAIGALLGKDSGGGETQAEIADREFNTFMDGLRFASQVLENFGNVGSSVENQITSLQDAISSQNKIIVDSQASLSATKEQYGETSSVATGLINIYSDQLFIAQKLTSDYMSQLDKIVTDSLASTLDISKLTTTQLSEMTSSIDVKAAEEMAIQLNNLALEAKQSGGALEDNAAAIAILTDENYKAYVDNKEAIDLLNDAEKDRLKTLEDERKAIEANTKVWQDSFKSQDELLASTAKTLKNFEGFKKEKVQIGPDDFMTVNVAQWSTVEVAKSLEELDALYIQLANDTDKLTEADTNFLFANKAVIEARLSEQTSLQNQFDLLKGTTTQRELDILNIDSTNQALQRAIWAEQDRQDAIKETEKVEMDRLEAEKDRQDAISKTTKLINEEMLGSLSYFNQAEKLAYANNLYTNAITQEDRVSSARTLAELSQGTARTREDFVPVFAQYINEVKKQGEQATLTDVVNKLDEVVTGLSSINSYNKAIASYA